jgi:S-formylglutathione hydrolase FrmB
MAICQVHWFSKTLDKTVAATILLPEVGQPPFATYYLLHGLSDDHTIWHRRTRVEWYVRQLPLIVVMPDGYRGFYTDIERGPAYARYISEELLPFVERNFPARSSRPARCIGGNSMGGYGALRAALAYPHLYASANSHSGALMHGSRKWSGSGERDRSEVFGKDPRGTTHDLLKLASNARRKRQLPRLLIDCGRDDFLIQDNRAFHAKLRALRVPHEYVEHPGEHNWDYWDAHVCDAIAFHARVMGVKSSWAVGPAVS